MKINVKIIGIAVIIIVCALSVLYFKDFFSTKDPNQLMNRGNEEIKKGAYDKAVESYTKAIELKEGDYILYYNRGVASMNKGDYDGAVKDFTKSIELSPNQFPAYNNRGQIYLNKGMYDEAIKDYTKIIGLNKNFSTAYYGRGMAYYQKGQNKFALSDLKTAFKMGHVQSKDLIKIIENKNK